LRRRWSREDILRHEQILYPERERLSLDEYEKGPL
jgi:hypothetical protein